MEVTGNVTAAAAIRWRTFTETCAADVTARVVFGLDDVIISLDVVLNIGVTGAALPILVVDAALVSRASCLRIIAAAISPN